MATINILDELFGPSSGTNTAAGAYPTVMVPQKDTTTDQQTNTTGTKRADGTTVTGNQYTGAFGGLAGQVAQNAGSLLGRTLPGMPGALGQAGTGAEQQVGNLGAYSGRMLGYSGNLASMGGADARTESIASGLMGPTTAGAFGAAERDAYMSPYLDYVRQTTLADADQKAAQEAAAFRAASAQKQAFGARTGIAEASLLGEQARARSALDAQLLQQGYTQAQAQFNSDADRKLTAAQITQQGLTSAGNLTQSDLARRQGAMKDAAAVDEMQRAGSMDTLTSAAQIGKTQGDYLQGNEALLNQRLGAATGALAQGTQSKTTSESASETSSGSQNLHQFVDVDQAIPGVPDKVREAADGGTGTGGTGTGGTGTGGTGTGTGGTGTGGTGTNQDGSTVSSLPGGTYQRGDGTFVAPDGSTYTRNPYGPGYVRTGGPSSGTGTGGTGTGTGTTGTGTGTGSTGGTTGGAGNGPLTENPGGTGGTGTGGTGTGGTGTGGTGTGGTGAGGTGTGETGGTGTGTGGTGAQQPTVPTAPLSDWAGILGESSGAPYVADTLSRALAGKIGAVSTSGANGNGVISMSVDPGDVVGGQGKGTITFGTQNGTTMIRVAERGGSYGEFVLDPAQPYVVNSRGQRQNLTQQQVGNLLQLYAAAQNASGGSGALSYRDGGLVERLETKYGRRKGKAVARYADGGVVARRLGGPSVAELMMRGDVLGAFGDLAGRQEELVSAPPVELAFEPQGAFSLDTPADEREWAYRYMANLAGNPWAQAEGRAMLDRRKDVLDIAKIRAELETDNRRTVSGALSALGGEAARLGTFQNQAAQTDIQAAKAAAELAKSRREMMTPKIKYITLPDGRVMAVDENPYTNGMMSEGGGNRVPGAGGMTGGSGGLPGVLGTIGSPKVTDDTQTADGMSSVGASRKAREDFLGTAARADGTRASIDQMAGDVDEMRDNWILNSPNGPVRNLLAPVLSSVAPQWTDQDHAQRFQSNARALQADAYQAIAGSGPVTENESKMLGAAQAGTESSDPGAIMETLYKAQHVADRRKFLAAAWQAMSQKARAEAKAAGTPFNEAAMPSFSDWLAAADRAPEFQFGTTVNQGFTPEFIAAVHGGAPDAMERYARDRARVLSDPSYAFRFDRLYGLGGASKVRRGKDGR